MKKFKEKNLDLVLEESLDNLILSDDELFMIEGGVADEINCGAGCGQGCGSGCGSGCAGCTVSPDNKIT